MTHTSPGERGKSKLKGEIGLISKLLLPYASPIPTPLHFICAVLHPRKRLLSQIEETSVYEPSLGDPLSD